MNSIGTSSTEAGQRSLKQPARKGWMWRTGPSPLAAAIAGGSDSCRRRGLGRFSGAIAGSGSDGGLRSGRRWLDRGIQLAQLNAIRWDLDGDGSTTDTESGYAAAFPDAVSGMGCPSAGCTGYELDVDLDFDTNDNGEADSDDDYWNDGAGWEPIGGDSNFFIATFDGNGHTISNLFINRGSDSYVGLFGYTIPPGVIRNTGLLSVNVTGATRVGGLVGRNLGSITSSYTAGSVAGTGNWIGGLAGVNYGTVTASHASGSVTGYYGGGLGRVELRRYHRQPRLRLRCRRLSRRRPGRAEQRRDDHRQLRLRLRYRRQLRRGPGRVQQLGDDHHQLLGYRHVGPNCQRRRDRQDHQRAPVAHRLYRHLRRLECGY